MVWTWTNQGEACEGSLRCRLIFVRGLKQREGARRMGAKRIRYHAMPCGLDRKGAENVERERASKRRGTRPEASDVNKEIRGAQ